MPYSEFLESEETNLLASRGTRKCSCNQHNQDRPVKEELQRMDEPVFRATGLFNPKDHPRIALHWLGKMRAYR